MKSLTILFLLLSSSLAHTANKPTSKDLSALGQVDEKNLERTHLQKNTALPPNNDTSLALICKNPEGREFKKGDIGYDACLLNTQNPPDLKKPDPGIDPRDEDKKRELQIKN